MSREPTPFEKTIGAQRDAAAPDSSAWVSANAGSGKTRVLTDRVIRLMLAGAEPAQILSITFTKAAAAEMSNRLFERLSGWATSSDEELRGHLVELAGAETGGAYPLDAARRLFARALETPGGLKIQTIHAFAESVLGRFPIEAGLSPEFGVMDDAAAAELLDDIKRRLIAGAQVPPEVAAAIDRLLDEMADASFDELLARTIMSRRLIRTALENHGGVQGTTVALRGHFGLSPDATLDRVREEGAAFGAWDEVGLRRVVRALREAGNKTALEKADGIDAWLMSDDAGRLESLDDYMRLFLKQDGGPLKPTTIYGKGAEKADPGGMAVVEAEQERVVELADRMRAASLCDRTADLLTVSEVLLRDYRAAKRRLSLLDFDDQIETTLELLESSAAWVHYKLDQGVDHILIDEAQDTSPEQWRIAELLSGEFFAGEGAREKLRTVFAVGDEKQSIYSFQGADPEGFDRMRQHFRGQAGDIGSGFRDLRLELSFRSAPAILQAVDAVFAGPAGAGLTASGTAVAHEARREQARGLVEIWPMEEPVTLEEPDRWRAPMDTEGAASPRRRLAQRIARHIRGLIDRGETVDGDDGKPRRIKPGDIMILVRRRDALVEEIARALKAPEIRVPVAGSDRMKLASQIAVLDLMALGEFLLLPEDDLTLAAVLKSPFYNLTDDDLFELAHGRDSGVRLWRALRDRADERPAWRAAVDELTELMAAADQVTPFALYSDLLSARGGRRRLYARLGADQIDPLDEFLNAALADERDHPPSLQGFLFRMRRSEAEIKRDMEQTRDAVRIMTVHGAKGLEAPVVILPDTARPPRPSSGGIRRLPSLDGPALPAIGLSKQASPDRLAQQAEADEAAMLAEYNRLLYVAMTRAKDRLYVCGFYNSDRVKPSDLGWYRLVETALEPIGERDAEGVLRLGAPPPPDSGEGSEAALVAGLPDWLTAPPPDEPAPPRPLAPSRTDAAEPAVASPLAGGAPGLDGRRRGVLIHTLLEVLPGLEPAARRETGLVLLARRARDLDEPLRAELLEEALAVIEAPDIAPAFAPGSRAEAAIAGLVGTAVVSGQVDRLAVTAESVWIVDYKTNRPPPADVAGVAPVYLRQMALYREVLRQIHPGKTVISALVWTWETRLMVLPGDALDAALASLDLTKPAT
ncbi:MAG: double-strand break repair helicase AddA [Minwuia sp.]|uniref:double-strand break repair helicase AddA n=1 Tax=Minwuia sp. TaxID=2493630 RepID=UPI003A8ACA7B